MNCAIDGITRKSLIFTYEFFIFFEILFKFQEILECHFQKAFHLDLSIFQKKKKTVNARKKPEKSTFFSELYTSRNLPFNLFYNFPPSITSINKYNKTHHCFTLLPCQPYLVYFLFSFSFLGFL